MSSDILAPIAHFRAPVFPGQSFEPFYKSKLVLHGWYVSELDAGIFGVMGKVFTGCLPETVNSLNKAIAGEDFNGLKGSRCWRRMGRSRHREFFCASDPPIFGATEVGTAASTLGTPAGLVGEGRQKLAAGVLG
jgi:hypothetical protein